MYGADIIDTNFMLLTQYENVESVRITFEGDKPINTSGGLIGCGHLIGAFGALMFLDFYKQVIETERQVRIRTMLRRIPLC